MSFPMMNVLYFYISTFCSIIIIIIIIIAIIIIIIIISFMQGIYTYIPETNHVPREYSVSAILSLLFMVSKLLVPAFALLYFYIRTFEVCNSSTRGMAFTVQQLGSTA